LATILLRDEDEELTAERLEGAVRALRRIHLRRRLDSVQRELRALGASADLRQKTTLGEEAMRLKRALMDPGLAEGGSAGAA
jgi:uncharacterized protein (UPF0128 family)